MLVYTDEEILTFAIFCGTQSGIAHCFLEREAVVQIEDDKRLIARSIKQQASQLYYKRAVRSGSNPVPTDGKFEQLLRRLDEAERKSKG